MTEESEKKKNSFCHIYFLFKAFHRGFYLKFAKEQQVENRWSIKINLPL